MKRTEILCPECFKGKLLTSNEINANCDRCGEQFIITGKNSVRYKKDSDLSEEQREIQCDNCGFDESNEEKYTVWVGGIPDVENVSKEEAEVVAKEWRDKGYDDVIIEAEGGGIVD